MKIDPQVQAAIIIGICMIIAAIIGYQAGLLPIPKLSTTLPNIEITITEPKDGVTVYNNPVRVSGTVKNFTNDDILLWACVKSYDGIWYPQETLTLIGEEIWEADTKPGFSTNPADIGKEFGIIVLVATEEADEELRKPLKGKGDAADGWGLKALPKGTKILDDITVMRGRK